MDNRDLERKFYYDTRDQEFKEEWRVHGQLHREGEPAFTVYYYPELTVATEEYWHHGTLHRTDGPAMIYYNLSGHVWQERYYHYFEFHRTDGPAQIIYENGITKNEWFLHGVQVKENEFEELLKLPERELLMQLAKISRHYLRFGHKMQRTDEKLAKILLASAQIAS